MVRFPLRARNWLACTALLFAAALLAAPQSPPSHRSARAPRTIVLPQALQADSPATLAVLDSAGRLMPAVSLELSGRPSVTTDSTGRASFIAPPGPGVLVVWTANRGVSATATIEAAASATPPSGPTSGNAPAAAGGPGPTINLASYPQFISPDDQFTITGSGFRGEADANHVFVADQPCLILAASPLALTVLPQPHVPIGAAVLRVTVPGPSAGQAEAEKPVAVVSLEVSGPSQNVRVGSQGTLTVQARGTADRVQVELRNTSPAIVQLAGGNMQRIVTSGGDRNIAQVPMKFLASGDYTITAHLLPATADASGT